MVDNCIRTGRITWTVIFWPGLILVPAVGREMKLLCAKQPIRLRKMVKIAANFIAITSRRNIAHCFDESGDFIPPATAHRATRCHDSNRRVRVSDLSQSHHRLVTE